MTRRRAYLLVVLLLAGPVAVWAASPTMPSAGTAVFPMSFHLTGDVAAANGIITFPAGDNIRILYVTATAQAKSGTQGTSTLQCKNAGNNFTNAMDLGTPAAGTPVEATLTAAQLSIVKDALVTCDLVITGGTTPKLFNITVQMWSQRN